MIPTHFNQQFASTTQFWNGTDSETNFKTNCAIEYNYKKLEKLGWLNTDALTYKFNSEGFRDDEFDQRPAGLALGCSHTQGTGLQAEQTWPKQLQNLLGQQVWNLGVGGAALDTCYRLLEYWIKQLNIKFVVCAVPGIARYEVFGLSGWSSILPTMQAHDDVPGLADWQKNYLIYDQNSELNRQKNLQAMKHICDQQNIAFYHDLLEDFVYDHAARDLMHCGPRNHQRLAKKFFNSIKEKTNETTTSSH
jgi:hypothetical protein